MALLSATIGFVQHLKTFKNAQKEMAELEKELSTLCSVLYMLGNLGPSPQWASEKASAVWSNTIRSLGIENGPLAEYPSSLAKLSAKIGSNTRLGASFAWVCVKEMLERIERLKSTIALHRSVSQLYVSLPDCPSRCD